MPGGGYSWPTWRRESHRPDIRCSKKGNVPIQLCRGIGRPYGPWTKGYPGRVRRVSDPDPNVRRVALQTLEGEPTGTFPGVRQVSMQIAADDPDSWIREMALGALARYTFDPEVVSLMIKSLTGADETEQTRAAVYLTWVVSTA